MSASEPAELTIRILRRRRGSASSPSPPAAAQPGGGPNFQAYNTWTAQPWQPGAGACRRSTRRSYWSLSATNTSIRSSFCGLQSKENQYRAEDLSYLIFHDLNEVRPLPNSLEKSRPMITHM